MLTTASDPNKSIQQLLHQSIEQPLFKTNRCLWVKEDEPKEKLHKIVDKVKEEKKQFYKLGKILGLKTIRYCLYDSGTLYCYQEKQDSFYYGYCKVKDLYFNYVQKQQEGIIRLTNGFQQCQMFFSDIIFFRNLKQKLTLDTVQFNFSQKYEIIKELGRGSSARVFKCKRRSTSEIFAMKQIPKEQQSTISTFSMVKSQKNILGSLKSQYIYHLEQFFQCNDNYILVLQCIEGINLKQIAHTKNSQIHYQQRVQILRQALQAIKICHSKKIIHRDIKPENVIYLVDKKQIKLIDFGLALDCSKFIESTEYIRCGTFGYMAPEVIKNHGDTKSKYDYKCDIFSFGLVAHKLLCGYNPLIGNTFQQTYCKNRQCNHIQLNKVQIQYKFGKNCVQFLTTLLQNDPKARATAQKGLQMNFFSQKQASQSTQQNDHKLQDLHCISSQNYHFDNDLNEQIQKLPNLPILKCIVSQKQIKADCKQQWKQRT